MDQMKNLSLDNIINLYKIGYKLDENIHNLGDPIVDPVVNFGKVILSTGYSGTDTSVVLSTGNGSILPDPSIGQYNLVWWNSTDYPDPADDPNKEMYFPNKLSDENYCP